jgi:hypothetical protein
MIKWILVFLRKLRIIVSRSSILRLERIMDLDRERVGSTLSGRGCIGLFARYDEYEPMVLDIKLG